jgi:hypothetical protein
MRSLHEDIFQKMVAAKKVLRKFYKPVEERVYEASDRVRIFNLEGTVAKGRRLRVTRLGRDVIIGKDTST